MTDKQGTGVDVIRLRDVAYSYQASGYVCRIMRDGAVIGGLSDANFEEMSRATVRGLVREWVGRSAS